MNHTGLLGQKGDNFKLKAVTDNRATDDDGCEGPALPHEVAFDSFMMQSKQSKSDERSNTNDGHKIAI